MSDGAQGGRNDPLVVICRELRPAGRQLLDGAAAVREGRLDIEREELLAMVPGAVAIVADPTIPIDGDLLDAAGAQLRLVANYAVGYDNVDLDACRERQVAVSNTPDVLTDATAELALALTLAAARDLGAAERDLRAGGWRGLTPSGYLGAGLTGATFGIVGAGRIGGRYAQLVAPLASEIIYVAGTPKSDLEKRLGARRVELSELLGEADVVSLHAPASTETAGMIGAAELAAMKDSAILVNTARGSLVDEEALASALEAGEIGAAGLDVFQNEPAVPESLLAAPHCVLLPHIGSATHTARDAMAELVARNVLAVLDGDEPCNRVA